MFLAEANLAFAKVTRVPTKSLPKGCQVEHIELYELQERRQVILEAVEVN